MTVPSAAAPLSPAPPAPRGGPRRPGVVALTALAIAVAGVVAAGAVTGCGTSGGPGVGPGGVAPAETGGLAGSGETGELGPEGVPPDHDTSAAVVGLDADLLEALRAAARDAEADGVEVVVTSGWRSAAHQQDLFDRAVAERGSPEEAARFVLPPELSAHVRGEAVDVGFTEAAYWMAENGSDHGLCQVYSNEVWHYELATTPGGTCPEQLPDSSAALP